MNSNEIKKEIVSLELEIEVLNEKRDKLREKFIKATLSELGFKEGQIVEVFREKGWGINKPIWVRGFLKKIKIGYSNEIECALGKIKKDGTPASIGDEIYTIYLTGEEKNKIRIV